MARTRPYQTLIFRLLHAGQGILAILGVLTGYWLLNTWDPQFGGLPFPRATESIMEFHEEIGGIFGGAIAIFILYSLWAGRRRLIQLKSLSQLTKIGKPVWWYVLHRIVNTSLLIFGSLAVLSGDKIDDDALRNGIFSDWAYTLHVLAWLGLVLGTLFHILLSLKVGGMPLLLSIVSLKVRSNDRPIHWPQRLYNWLKTMKTRWQKTKEN